MRTVDLGPLPPELAVEVERRRAIGADLYDEMWDGEYVMAPLPTPRHAAVQARILRLLDPVARRRGLEAVFPVNVGDARNFRVPDVALLRTIEDSAFLSSAALVVEVLSPRDRAWEKLGFYAAHEVDEVVIVDPAERTVAWLARHGDGYRPVERSALLDISVSELIEGIDWP